jgi:hypothetical protein
VRTDQMARAAGRLAGRWLPVAKRQSGKLAEQWVPTAKQSGNFVKHVLPAAVKPLHSLWHDILGFTFLAVAALVIWGVWRRRGGLEPGQLVLAIIFIVIMVGYGVSSLRKSRRISRS